MSDLTKKQFFPRTGVTETACIPLRLTTIVAGLLLTVMPFLLILVRVQGETNNPGPGTDTPHAVSIRG